MRAVAAVASLSHVRVRAVRPAATRVGDSLAASLLAALVAAAARCRCRSQRRADRGRRAAVPPRSRSTPNASSAGMRQAKDHGFLWRVAKDGRTSYLYGTIHAAQAGVDVPRPAHARPRSRRATSSRSSSTCSTPTCSARLAQAATARPDERLPAAARARIERRMAAECVDAEPWRGSRPSSRSPRWRPGGAPRRARSGVRDRPRARRDRARFRQGDRLARDARGADAGAADAVAGGDDRVRQQQPRRARLRPRPADARPHGEGLDRRQPGRARRATSAGATASTPPPSARR